MSLDCKHKYLEACASTNSKCNSKSVQYDSKVRKETALGFKLNNLAQNLPSLRPSLNSFRFPVRKLLSCVAIRRHSGFRGAAKWPPSWTMFLPVLLFFFCTCVPDVAQGCSSRSTPRPRPLSPTLRPNITFQTYSCPPAYAAWYCLNGATCFTVKISESILYNCECADGYMGQRCEYKDLDGSYLRSGQKVLLETASIAGGAALIIILVFFGIFSVFVLKNKQEDRELDGVPRISININNSWSGPHDGNTPIRYCEHHTITTTTTTTTSPHHPNLLSKLPHHEKHSLPLHHSSSLPHPPSPLSSHSLVSVGGKTQSSDAVDGSDAWGTPDRIVRTVTTITDLASIYSGRKQAIHRVEVVQEVDLLDESKVSFAPALPCAATPPWASPGPPRAFSLTASPSWNRFKGSPLIFNPNSDNKVPVISPKSDLKMLVSESSCKDVGLPNFSPLPCATDLFASQSGKLLVSTGSNTELQSTRTGQANRPDLLPVTPTAANHSITSVESRSPPPCVHVNRITSQNFLANSNFNVNQTVKSDVSEKSKSNLSLNPTLNFSPNPNQTPSFVLEKNVGTDNAAFTGDEV